MNSLGGFPGGVFDNFGITAHFRNGSKPAVSGAWADSLLSGYPPSRGALEPSARDRLKVGLWLELARHDHNATHRLPLELGDWKLCARRSDENGAEQR